MKAMLLTMALLALSAGCGSDEGADEQRADSESASSGASKSAEEDLWAPHVVAEDSDSERAGASAERKPHPDPDTVPALHHEACSRDLDSARCRALHRELEFVFLNDLIGLRAARQPLERAWLRTAARAQNPYLACLGLRGLLFAGEITAEEDALFVAALDSPWQGPRNFAIAYASKLAYVSASEAARLNELLGRAGARGTPTDVDLCVESRRDTAPNPGLAGRYPGARYRPFASTADLRWFTTPDSPEKVLAFLTRGGKPAQTGDELKAAQEAAYLEQTMKLYADAPPDSDLTVAAVKLGFEAGRDWSEPFTNLERVGEIRYVMITPKQAVAVFRDDVLGATAIVAPRPVAFDPAAFGL